MKNLFQHVFAAAFAAFFLTPLAASAQSCIEYTGDDRLILRDGNYYGPVEEVVSYFALIAERDLYNSRGVRLNDFRAIMQQDRANLHKSGTADSYVMFLDDGTQDLMSETAEYYFTTLERRTLLSSARYFQYCYSNGTTSTLEAEIARGQVNAAILRVTVFRHPDGGLAVLIAAIG